MIENQEQKQTVNNGCLGRLVDETTGEPKEPSHCIIQYGGRVRLPDKLMEILNKEFAPEVVWWQPDGECFAFDSDKVQEKILDVWFRGTKLSSFIRSLNRWGFRRVFYHALPESALAFHHVSFRKNSTPEMLKSMKMSKSGGKASQAMAAAPSKAAESPAGLPKNLHQAPTTMSVMSASNQSNLLTPSRLSQLSELGFSAMLPQLPLSNNTGNSTPSVVSSSATSSSSNSEHEILLKLLGEQRNRELLALAAAHNNRRSSFSAAAAPAPFPAPTSASAGISVPALQRFLQQHREEERQKLLIQELLAKQHQQQQQEQQRQQQQQRQHQQDVATIRMALLALQQQSRQSPTSML